MSFTRCVSHFDISPLNPDTSPEEEIPNTACLEMKIVVVNECLNINEKEKKNSRLFILTTLPVFQVDKSPLKDLAPLNTNSANEITGMELPNKCQRGLVKHG